MNPNLFKGAAGGIVKRPMLRMPEANRLLQHALKFQKTGVIKMNEQQIIDLASTVERPDGTIDDAKLEQLRKIVVDAIEADNLRSGAVAPPASRSLEYTHQTGPSSWERKQSETSSKQSDQGGSGCVVS